MKRFCYSVLLLLFSACAAMNPGGETTRTLEGNGVKYTIKKQHESIKDKKNDVLVETQLFFQHADYLFSLESSAVGIKLNGKEAYTITPVPTGGAVGRISGIIKFTNTSDKVITPKDFIAKVKLNGKDVNIKAVFSHGTNQSFEMLPNDWVAWLFVTTEPIDFSDIPSSSKLTIAFYNFPTKVGEAGQVVKVSNFISEHRFTVKKSNEKEEVAEKKYFMTDYEARALQNEVGFRKINENNAIDYEKRSVLTEFQEVLNQYPVFGLGQETEEFKLKDLFLPIQYSKLSKHQWTLTEIEAKNL